MPPTRPFGRVAGATVSPAFVSAKVAPVVTPVAPAVTVYVPVVAFAVKVDAVATPFPFVVTVAVVMPPVKVPLAPLPGAVKVTATPGRGEPPVSVRVAARGCAK